jgi:transcriptional regulator with XRE-family HTH domain
MFKFGSNLKKYRKINGMNQINLAEMVGVKQGTIANYENGNRTPAIEMLMKLAGVFGVSVDELLGSKENTMKKSDNISINKEEFKDSIVNYLVSKKEYELIKVFKAYYKESNDVLSKTGVKYLTS